MRMTVTMADNDDQKSTRSDDDKDYFDNIDPEELVSPNFNSILKWCRGLCLKFFAYSLIFVSKNSVFIL